MRLPAPKVMILFPSFQCNARCVMCYIWIKQRWTPQLSLEQLKRIVADPLIRRSVEVVAIAGGEPTLRSDLVEMAQILVEACGRLKTIDIPTNGLQTERVIDQIEQILALLANTRVVLSVTISVDGVGAVHEAIRGRQGVFPQVNQTLQELRELQAIYPRFRLGMNTVISRHNAKREILQAMRGYAKSHGVGLNFTVGAISEIGVESAAVREQFEMAPEHKEEAIAFFEELRERGGLDHIGPRYADFILHWLRTGERNLGCAFRNGKVFLVEPTGDAYLCGNYKDFKLGNLVESSLSEIWPIQKRLTHEMWQRRCETCVSNCFIGES